MQESRLCLVHCGNWPWYIAPTRDVRKARSIVEWRLGLRRLQTTGLANVQHECITALAGLSLGRNFATV